MSLITRTYTFTDGTTAYGSQVDSEIANIVNTLNSLDNASTTWTNVKVTTLSPQANVNMNSHQFTNLGTPNTAGNAAIYPVTSAQLDSGVGSRILQTVSTLVSGSQLSTTNTAFTSTNVAGSITVSATTSKVRISIITTGIATAGETLIWSVYVNGSFNLGSSSGGFGFVGSSGGNIVFTGIHSPNSVGAVSYSIFIRSVGGASVSCPAASAGTALYAAPTVLLEEIS